jgi:DNA polymerase, archaea type
VEPADRRDYDVEHYARVLRDTFAARLARAFAPHDFAEVFADADQLSLFAPSTAAMRPVLETRGLGALAAP